MLNSFLTVGQQVLILFMLIAVGYVLGKLKMIDEHSSRSMSNIVLSVVTPCLSVVSFQRPLEKDSLSNFCLVFLISIGIHVGSILLSRLVIRDKEYDRRAPLCFSVIFSNSAFMAYPLQTALLGSIGVFYGSAYVAVFTILLWTYGVYLMTGDRSRLKLRPILLTPNIIGIVAALALYLLQISLPPIVLKPMEYISSLSTPLPMLVIGYQLQRADLRRALRSAGAWLSIALRLVIVPLLTLGLCLLLGTDSTVTVSLVVAASAPAAAMLSMFATRFEKDTELASSLVSAHTLLSALTMPLIVGLAQYLA